MNILNKSIVTTLLLMAAVGPASAIVQPQNVFSEIQNAYETGIDINIAVDNNLPAIHNELDDKHLPEVESVNPEQS